MDEDKLIERLKKLRNQWRGNWSLDLRELAREIIALVRQGDVEGETWWIAIEKAGTIYQCLPDLFASKEEALREQPNIDLYLPIRLPKPRSERERLLAEFRQLRKEIDENRMGRCVDVLGIVAIPETLFNRTLKALEGEDAE